MKKRIRTNRLHRYIFASGLIRVSLGIGISCSKDAGISSIDPTSTDDGVSSRRMVGTKPAVGGSNYADFHPQTGVNYDPFAGMTLAQRKAALGGSVGAVKHLQVVARHVAQAMQDKDARALLHRVVPKEKDGDVHLSQIMIDNPKFFGLASEGFKDAVSDKGIRADLSEIINGTPSNGEAILKASKALVDVVLTLVTPPGKEWDLDEKIPVFSAPLDDSPGSVMEGVDADLKPIFLTLHKGDPPYAFLFLNFDEDSPVITEGMSLSLEPELTPVERLWASWQNTLQSISLTTPAYAHQYTGITHDSHSSLVAQAHRITIYDTNEGWGGGDPEVYVTIRIRLRLISDHTHEDKDDLPDVNELNIEYDDYEDLRSTHGVRQEWNNNLIRKLRVMEYDFGSADDQMGEWVNIHLPIHGRRKLLDPNTSVNGRDARVIIVKHAD